MQWAGSQVIQTSSHPVLKELMVQFQIQARRTSCKSESLSYKGAMGEKRWGWLTHSSRSKGPSVGAGTMGFHTEGWGCLQGSRLWTAPWSLGLQVWMAWHCIRSARGRLGVDTHDTGGCCVGQGWKDGLDVDAPGTILRASGFIC